MRRIRRLDFCDYIVPIGQRINQLITTSNLSNIFLERTWHNQDSLITPQLHAFFESDNFDGFRVRGWLSNKDIVVSSSLSQFNIYSVNILDWTKTLILSKPSVQNGLYMDAHVTQSDLGLYELTGSEVYFIEALFTRKRKQLYVGKYFNHLGIYDSMFRLKQEVDFLDITKKDE